MRLFLFNPQSSFDTDEIGERAQAFPLDVRHEIENMNKMGLIKPKKVVKAIGKKKKNGHEMKRRIQAYHLDTTFPYLRELEAILTNTVPIRNGDIVKRLNRTGKIKLLIVSGFFIQNSDSRVDLLLVGDNLRKKALEQAVKYIESEVGKELRYAAFETSDFQYRLSVYDKLVKDILDYEYRAVVDKLGLTRAE